ncbi:TetR/AcrR family transcriptional regulator [Conexibacter sp. CPCC 206217]|uniref:TetR/AcrR family transcriptional regulator n=1 Tax=Conexibacter sp. CPCC 206217 TaxID=3064574 RepID=UPI00271E41EA|nr:TetR/AcrR family transcriptional regulator [Conexibacter sp. CPCC 206217]MDO8211663.1 TetR/AcrR family transcriptional regulator [Conexibacter sp. CPCC 206217]
MPPGDARERLLEKAIAHIAQRGVSDLSLRELAGAIGTSHRMLIHHFGSKEGLWVEVIRAVERQQRAALPQLVPDPSLDPAEAMRTWWQHISDPSLWPNERLFFELYGQALQGRPGTTELLDGIVDAWLDPIAEINVAQGMDPATARAMARLGIAVTRGLLLDLLATGDRAGTDAAVEAWIALNAAAAARSRPADR